MATETTRNDSRELLAAGFALTKNALVFDDKNAALLRACDRMANAANGLRARGQGMASLRMLADGLYINEQLARFDATAYEQAEYLCTVWRSAGVGEIAAMADTSADDWLDLTRELMRCIRGEADAVRAQGSVALAIATLEQVALERRAETGPRARAARAFAVTTLAMEDALVDLHHGRPVRTVELKRPLLELVDAASECRDLLLALVLGESEANEVAQHLVNTATLTICMADQLGLDRWLSAALALQACLHDLGRAAADVASAADVEARELERTTESICALLRSSSAPRVEPARVVVANEVRLWANADPDSGDYPYAPSGAARLIAVASAYGAMTASSARGPGLLPDEAVRVLMAEAGRRYDDAAVRVLADLLGAFPVGSLVALGNGQLAIPLRASSSDDGWARPLVKIVREPGGATCDGPVLDLARDGEGQLRIERCVDPGSQGINPAAFLLG